MKALVAWTFALGAYALGNLAFLSFIAFTTGLAVVHSVDSGVPIEPLQALAIDVALIGLFGLQHSIMARQGFKRGWLRLVPAALERSGFVLASAAALALLVWQWQPLPTMLWHIDDPWAWWLVQGVALLGWGLVFASTFAIDHFELFGLRQVHANLTGRPMPPSRFRTPWLYRIVRHPMQLGVLIGLWVTPAMSVGHLLLATGMTMYVLIGLVYEERDLVAAFGARYRAYRASTPRLLPRLRLRRTGAESGRGQV